MYEEIKKQKACMMNQEQLVGTLKTEFKKLKESEY